MSAARHRSSRGRSTSSLDAVELTAAAIDNLVDAQVASMASPAMVELVARFRVPPRLEFRPWDYGGDEAYPCWLIFEHSASNTAIAYCGHGFGPRAPWGLLFIKGPHQSMGMDSGWFSTLEDAIRDSCAIDDLRAGNNV